MKRKISTLFLVAGLLLSANQYVKAQGVLTDVIIDAIGSHCFAGGEGATSCSLTIEAGGEGATFGANASVTVEVSCGNGYYACCGITGANCKEN